MIEIQKDELEDLCFCSLRYALGRKTYITYVISRLIIKYAEHLQPWIKSKMAHEIRRAIDTDRAGMSCDIVEWEKLFGVLTSE